MSLYNMVHGTDPSAKFVLTLLHLNDPKLRPDTQYYGRIRDAWVEKDDGKYVLSVYTRNGGGNREHYDDVPAGKECSCTGCIITHRLPADPLYLRDADDTFDNTYATVKFRLPDNYVELIKEAGVEDPDALLEQLSQPPRDSEKMWNEAIDNLTKK